MLFLTLIGRSTQCLRNLIFFHNVNQRCRSVCGLVSDLIASFDLEPDLEPVRNRIRYSQSGIHWILKLRHWFKYMKKYNSILNSYLLFSSTRVSYRYHLAHRTYTGELEQRQTLYISLPESHRLIRIKNLENPTPVDRYRCRIIDCSRQCCGSGIPSRSRKKYYETRGNMIWSFFVPDPDFFHSRILDPGVKIALDTGSGSAILVTRIMAFCRRESTPIERNLRSCPFVGFAPSVEILCFWFRLNLFHNNHRRESITVKYRVESTACLELAYLDDSKPHLGHQVKRLYW
jgi:hypothetical protein